MPILATGALCYCTDFNVQFPQCACLCSGTQCLAAGMEKAIVEHHLGGEFRDAAISTINTASEAATATVQGRPAMMPNFDKDFEAGRRLLSDNGLPVFEAPIHLEGGSIHSDGQGTMVVTEECLLDPSRNPDLGREGIEQVRGSSRLLHLFQFRTAFASHASPHPFMI